MDPQIARQFLMPNSLNYYGLMGPKGYNFGQVVYFCQQCALNNVPIYYMEFMLDEQQTNLAQVNLDAVADSPTAKFALKLQTITKENLSINEDKSQFLKKSKSNERKSNKTKTTKGSDFEEFISSEKL